MSDASKLGGCFLVCLVSVVAGCKRTASGAEAQTGGLSPDGPSVAAADAVEPPPPVAPDVAAPGSTGTDTGPAEASVFAAPELPLDQLPEPEVVWSHPVGSFSPSPVFETPAGPALIAFEPDRAVALLDARTGAVRWTARAAAGEAWWSVDAGTRDGEVLIVVDATAGEDRQLVLRLAADDGRTLWRTPVDSGFSVELTEWGRGIRLESYSACAARMLDPADGRLLGPRLAGTDYEVWDHRGAAGHRCGLSDVRTFGVSDGVGVAVYRDRDGQRFEGFGPAETPKWKRDLASVALLNAVAFDGTDGIFVEYDGQADYRTRRVVRLDLRTGTERWVRELDLGRACASPYVEGRVRRVPGPAGHATAVLVPDCVTTRALDPASGEPLWEVPADGFPLVVGEAPEEFASYGAGPLPVQRLQPDGTVAGRLVLPAATRYFWQLADGMIVTALEPRWTALLAFDGAVRWQAAVNFGNVFTLDAALVVLPPDVQLLIEPSAGRAWKYAAGSPWVLGRLPGAAGEAPLWLAMREEPDELVALRTTGEGYALQP